MGGTPACWVAMLTAPNRTICTQVGVVADARSVALPASLPSVSRGYWVSAAEVRPVREGCREPEPGQGAGVEPGHGRDEGAGKGQDRRSGKDPGLSAIAPLHSPCKRRLRDTARGDYGAIQRTSVYMVE
jgi:hypothetical protein